MALEPINVLFGAGVALMARELVEARKAKRRLVAGQDTILRAMKQELGEIRDTVALNLVQQLWDRKEAKWTHRNVHQWETRIDPPSPLPQRLDNLMRQDGPPELLDNSQVIGLLSYVKCMCNCSADQFDWGALQQLISENETFELTSATGNGGGGYDPRWGVLEHFGLAEQVDSGWFVTARGRLVAGSGERFWRRPRSPDPPQERVQFANLTLRTFSKVKSSPSNWGARDSEVSEVAGFTPAISAIRRVCFASPTWGSRLQRLPARIPAAFIGASRPGSRFG